MTRVVKTKETFISFRINRPDKLRGLVKKNEVICLVNQ